MKANNSFRATTRFFSFPFTLPAVTKYIMPISWNEIRQNAIGFSRDWADAKSEMAEKQTFWNEFFEVFGLRRRLVATFEEPVKKISGDYGFIDLLWPNVLLVEHKSFGKNLGKAESQAFRYIYDLIAAGRTDELPRYVIVSDFARIALHDLEPEDQKSFPLLGSIHSIEFPLSELHQNIHSFAFIPGYKQHSYEDQDPINLQAVEILGDLHDTMDAGGYHGHKLERFLVRILFCLFAEDTGIFEREEFRLYIENRTDPDGSDLGLHLARLFDVLNTDPSQRQDNLDETLSTFRYVNGDLFAERLDFADLNHDMRNAMLACTHFDWSRISPAVFGSLFQAVMEPRQRRQIGGHYTSERDILKVVRALFLDDLREEFKRVRKNKVNLRRFHKKISSLRFLDPACGCGNFLVITYRELRLLEIEVLKALHVQRSGQTQRVLDIQHLSRLDVDAFYGIEIGEWPASIAEVAMWLMDHQMNLRLSEAFGEFYVRLPLKKSPTIVCGNALRQDWKSILPSDKCSFVLGNPPFVGKKARNADQQEDIKLVFGGIKGTSTLDYVTCWYMRAAQYIQGTKIKTAFVSTNSITQGEQPGILWPILFQQYNAKIIFGYTTFPWESEARGKAHVHVVIIGFACIEISPKHIYDPSDASGNATIHTVGNISPYLVEGPDDALRNCNSPISKVPELRFGNMPNDNGQFLLNDEEKEELLREAPQAERYIRPFLSAREYLHGENRWCLWLKHASSKDIRDMGAIRRRLEVVKKYRSVSKRETTRQLADTPMLFGEIRQPDTSYILVPRHSSENRRYIPCCYFTPDYIVGDSCLCLPNATLYHFGVLSSAMHMAWLRQVCGRIKSDYRYSAKLVYNNYPWPDDPNEKKIATVEKSAQVVLDARAEFLPPRDDATLADLYDPISMPPSLLKAHTVLDKAVDLCYRPQPFPDERNRFEFLFALYEKLTAPLIPMVKKRKRRHRRI